jgi:hypothetical protein
LPQRERRDEEAVIQTPLDYGNISFPKRKRVYGKKPEPKVLKIEKEEGEVSDAIGVWNETTGKLRFYAKK